MAQLPVPARSEQLYLRHSPALSPDWKDWLAALRRTLAIAARYRDKTPKNPARAIHICRAQVKEARALLRLAPPSLREAAKACRNELAAAARLISAPRDAFIVSETLKELVKEELPHLDVRSLPSSLVRGANGRTRQDQHRALLQQASSAVHQVSAHIATWLVPADNPERLLDRAEKSWCRARKSIPDPLDTATEEHMHNFRKAVIICRYQTAFFRRHQGDRNSTVEFSLEKLRKKLGKINDLFRLEAELFRYTSEMDLDTFNLLQQTIQQQEKSIRKSLKETNILSRSFKLP